MAIHYTAFYNSWLSGGGYLFQPEGPQAIEEFSKGAAPYYLAGIVGVLQGLLLFLFHKSRESQLPVAGRKICGTAN
jgi:hypothetical protein